MAAPAALGWPERLFAPGRKRVLSIDGGGVRGALAIGFLQRLETVLRDRYARPDLVLSDYFDLIGGTSVGAILAAGLAMGRSADDAANTFAVMAERLFGRGGFRAPLLQARFSPARLQSLLEEEFGDVALGAAAWRTGFACVAKRVDTGSTWILTNNPRARYWEGSPEEIAREPDPARRRIVPNKLYPVAKVVQASAAAPFFFDMTPLEVANGERGVFFDGAMTPHGNPVLALAMTAMAPPYGFGWDAGADRLLVVSIGTGARRPRKPKWVDKRVIALWKALHALVSMSFDAGELGVSVMQWLGESRHPWPINSEVGDLSGARPRGYPPLWSFLRYDAPLDQAWLAANLDLSVTPQQAAKLARIDDARQIDALHAIGREAAERQIAHEHFPKAFAP